MNVTVARDKHELGASAAAVGTAAIREALRRRESVSIILATGTSQYDTLNALVHSEGIDWSRVIVFHLDEYVGLTDRHPASFRRYLRERFVQLIPTLGEFVPVSGESDPADVCRALGERIRQHPVDVAFVGIGENAHLAFNDPPAHFDAEEPYIVVELDQACRMQQVGEGWFNSIVEVPTRAISMSVRQIMASSCIVVSVPDRRKAQAVRCSVKGPVRNTCPASILQTHAACHLFLDADSASLLTTT